MARPSAGVASHGQAPWRGGRHGLAPTRGRRTMATTPYKGATGCGQPAVMTACNATPARATAPTAGAVVPWQGDLGGSSCVHRSLHWMKALVINIWGLYTTEEEVQRRVFRVCASKLVSDESLGHQHMGGYVPPREKSDCKYQEPDKSEDKAEYANVATKKAKEIRIDTSPATRWRRPCMRVTVCLSIDQGELLGGYSGVEAGGRKGRGSDDESSGA
ncbi:hypothetical protein BHE74_00032591 [Ensete ventricosum]|nr:hypothetical protein BHE74_00032591 [Ensete ventricosum]